MNNQGKLAVQILVVLVIIVLTSTLVMLLINSGAIKIKNTDTTSVLNTEFIPYSREGSVVIKEFKFCEYVSSNYSCINETNDFTAGNTVYFYFVVDSSAYNGEIKLVENYKVKSANGTVILDVDTTKSYNLNLKSKNKAETFIFKDYLFTYPEDIGNYTLDLIVYNPLLEKKTTLSKKFTLFSNEP